jgi:hypothetical protein
MSKNARLTRSKRSMTPVLVLQTGFRALIAARLDLGPDLREMPIMPYPGCVQNTDIGPMYRRVARARNTPPFRLN